MKPLFVRWLLISLLSLHGALVSAQPRTELPTGLWVSEERTAAGLGMSYVFLPDGSVVENFGAIVNFAYSLQGAVGTIAADGEDIRVELAADGRALTLHRSDMPAQTVFRAGPVDDPGSLIGLWRFRGAAGVWTELVFGAQGRGLMRTLLKQRQGTVTSAADGKFAMTLSSGQDRELLGRLKDQEMELQSGHRSSRVKRVDMR